MKLDDRDTYQIIYVVIEGAELEYDINIDLINHSEAHTSKSR